MGKEETVYTWSEVQLHTKKDDKWLVMDGQVYNITNWVSKHPGGSKVISHYAGQDATDAIRAFHNDLDKLKKYLKPLHLGAVQDIQNRSIDEDFRQLRSTAEQMGLFKPSFLFYAAVLTHIMVLEVLAYLTLYYFGTGWLPFIVSMLLYATMQVQVCFSSHDFGHLSVFHNRTWDHFFHFFTLGFLKGLSPVWWNQMHYQHHAKPNVLDKDPDVRLDKFCCRRGDASRGGQIQKASFCPISASTQVFLYSWATFIVSSIFLHNMFELYLQKKVMAGCSFDGRLLCQVFLLYGTNGWMGMGHLLLRGFQDIRVHLVYMGCRS